MTMTQDELDDWLLRSSKAGDLVDVRELIAAGAKIDVSDRVGQQALHFAAREGHVPVAAHLLLKGARIDCMDEDGEQPLHSAARRSDAAMAKFLLENGADPAVKDRHGRTPLAFAKECPEVQGLLKEWSDPEFREKHKRSAATETIAAHWKRMAGRLPKPGPRM